MYRLRVRVRIVKMSPLMNGSDSKSPTNTIQNTSSLSVSTVLTDGRIHVNGEMQHKYEQSPMQQPRRQLTQPLGSAYEASYNHAMASSSADGAHPRQRTRTSDSRGYVEDAYWDTVPPRLPYAGTCSSHLEHKEAYLICRVPHVSASQQFGAPH